MRRRATGRGRIAPHGTSPTGGQVDSLTMPRTKMAAVRTVQFFTATTQSSATTRMDGMMFLATGGSFTLFAKSQSVQVRFVGIS